MAHRQINQTLGIYLFSMLMLLTLLPPAHVWSLACNACGPECANACGTAMFRACCFNYNRKRSVPMHDFENMVTERMLDQDPRPLGQPDIVNAEMRPSFREPLFLGKWYHLLSKLSENPLVQELRKQHLAETRNAD